MDKASDLFRGENKLVLLQNSWRWHGIAPIIRAEMHDGVGMTIEDNPERPLDPSYAYKNGLATLASTLRRFSAPGNRL